MDITIGFGMFILLMILSLWNLLSHIRIDQLEKEVELLKRKNYKY